MTLSTTERSLTDHERQHIQERLARARAESARALWRSAAASGIVCGVLGIITLAVSDAPALVVIAFWGTAWGVFTAWVGLPWRRLMRGQVPLLESALQVDRARVVRITSARVVEFEEEEDEGACYAFEHDQSSSVFVVGQEFYADDTFPNTDFSIVEILGPAGHPIDAVVVGHGQTLNPERVIPASVKRRRRVPEHLEVVAAPLETIEQALPEVGEV